MVLGRSQLGHGGPGLEQQTQKREGMGGKGGGKRRGTLV